MSRRRSSRRAFLGRAVSLAAGLASVSSKAASDANRLGDECRRRMLLVYEALCRWKREHGADRWPERLPVLRQEGFLTDWRVWVCPLSERNGDLRFAPNNAGIISDSPYNPESNYNYEFNAEYVNEDEIDEPKNWEKREWKAALARTTMGGVVPVLRCMAHPPRSPDGVARDKHVHNVGVDGRFYLSSVYWEYEYSSRRPEPYTMPFLVRHHPDPAGKARMPRPPGLPAGCVDLEPIANANPDLPWLDGRPDGPTLDPFLAETGLGALMTPTPFDARVLVQTRGGLHETGTLATLRDGLGFLGTAYPSRSTPLPLDGRRARRLEVLHATAFRGTPGDVVGEVVVGVRGSPPIRVPLVFGRNTGWWRAEAASNADAPAWTARRGVDVLTLYRLVVDLPPSASEPESFALAADPRSLASPFVVGLTSI